MAKTKTEKPDAPAPAVTPIPAQQLAAMTTSARHSDLESQMALAIAHPRDLDVFFADAKKMIGMDSEVADGCHYELSIPGKSPVAGMSIRMAEVVAACYGNLQAEVTVLPIKDGDRLLTAKAKVVDVQRNFSFTAEVVRTIWSKDSGCRFSDHMIAVTAQAAVAIAYRNSVFKVVPKALLKPLSTEAYRIAMDDTSKNLVQRRDDARAAFGGRGVTEAQLCRRLGITSFSLANAADVVKLRGIWAAIKDQETTIEAEFPPEQAAPGAESPAQAGQTAGQSLVGKAAAEARAKDAAKGPPIDPGASTAAPATAAPNNAKTQPKAATGAPKAGKTASVNETQDEWAQRAAAEKAEREAAGKKAPREPGDDDA